MTILVLALILISGPSLLAQEEGSDSKSEAVVYLKGGSKIKGKIKEWVVNDYLILSMPWGSDVKYYSSQIKKVIQNGTDNTASQIYNFKEKGLYFSLKSQLITGNEGERASGRYGIGISGSVGHRFSRLFGIGGGIGYDRFIWDSGENLIPIFAEVSGFITPTLTSIFYNLEVGYSLAQTNDKYLLTEANGGIMIYPSIGIRFGKENTKFSFDVGYKFQKANFTYTDAFTITTTRKQDVFFKRFSLRFGIYL